MAGPLFRELAEDVSSALGRSILFTGHPDTLASAGSDNLQIKSAPGYDRRSNLRRLLSWIRYFFATLKLVHGQERTALLFIVSNPPFLGLIGYWYKRLRKQPYVVLVYDVYPDILIALGKMKAGITARMWRKLNRSVLEHADAVVVLSQDMKRVLDKHYDLGRTLPGAAVVIPNWADVDSIKPLKKSENWFAKEHGQLGKTTVLYSGNMGNTHDIEGILEVARLLKHETQIQFLFVGEGAKWHKVQDAIEQEKLENITLLPFQPEKVLPFSMTTGDIGVVPYHPGSEGCIVPSKSYYYMAAGVVPLIVSNKDTDLSEMVIVNQCGLSVHSGDYQAMANGIIKLAKDESLLQSFKTAARRVAEKEYSRDNTSRFTELLKDCCSC